MEIDGLPDSLCMVATDLTTRRRGEAAVLAAEVFELSREGIVIADAQSRVIRSIGP